MKKIIIPLGILLGIFALFPRFLAAENGQGQAEPGRLPPKYVEGEVLVVANDSPEFQIFMQDIEDQYGPIDRRDILEAADCPKIERHRWPDGEGPDVEQIINIYNAYGYTAQPNYIYKSFDDPLRDEQDPYPLGLNTDEGERGYMKVIQSWEKVTDPPSEPIILQISDTGGFDYTHPDLQDNIWVNEDEDLNQNGILDEGDLDQVDNDDNGYVDDVIGWDFTDCAEYDWQTGECLQEKEEDNDPSPDPNEFLFSHGTAVTSVAGAVTDNEYGMSGVIVPNMVKIQLAKTGRAIFVYQSMAIHAIHYAIRSGADIINMSWGKYKIYQNEDDNLLHQAIQCYTEKYNGLVIAAAGNYNNDEETIPASWPEVLAITASDGSNRRAGFSSYGYWTDIAAPGASILTIFYSPFNGERYWEYLDGTSFSAPHVSGIAANLWSQHPLKKNSEIKNRLLNSVYRPVDYDVNHPLSLLRENNRYLMPWIDEQDILEGSGSHIYPPPYKRDNQYYGRGIIDALEVMRPMVTLKDVKGQIYQSPTD